MSILIQYYKSMIIYSLAEDGRAAVFCEKASPKAGGDEAPANRRSARTETHFR